MQQKIDNKNKTQIKNANKEGKKGKATSFLLILIILLLTIVITFGAILLFNFGGLRNSISKSLVNVPVIGSLVKPIVEDKTPEEILREQLENEKKDLNIKLQQLNEKEKELSSKEKEIENKQNEISQKETEINTKLELLNEKILNVQEQVNYLEKIDSGKALQILLNMEKKESVIQILRSMKKEKASSILSMMDPLQAAQLLEDISIPIDSNTNNNQ